MGCRDYYCQNAFLMSQSKVLIICMSNFCLVHAFIAMWYSCDCVSFFSFSSFERMLDSKLREEESNIRVLVPDVKLYK